MCNKDSKERIPAEIAVASDCAVAVSAHTISRSFTDSDPTDDTVGLASIVTPEHRPPATDQRVKTQESGPVAVDTRSSVQVPIFCGCLGICRPCWKNGAAGSHRVSPYADRFARGLHKASVSGLFPFPKPVHSCEPTYTRTPLWAPLKSISGMSSLRNANYYSSIFACLSSSSHGGYGPISASKT
jgi:hypothetical protein